MNSHRVSKWQRQDLTQPGQLQTPHSQPLRHTALQLYLLNVPLIGKSECPTNWEVYISSLPLLIDSLYPQEAYYLVWEISTCEKLVTQVRFTRCQVSCLAKYLKKGEKTVMTSWRQDIGPSTEIPFYFQPPFRLWSCCLILKWSHSVMSDSFRPHGL